MSLLTAEQRERFAAIRRSLDGLVVKIADSASEINGNISAIRKWMPGVYSIGDVRVYEGVPYKCVQAHDSSANADWTPPSVPALWMQYHGTSKDTARPWVQPQGAHDQYLVGEWMIYHGAYYECVQNTVYTPDQYANAWHKG